MLATFDTKYNYQILCKSGSVLSSANRACADERAETNSQTFIHLADHSPPHRKELPINTFYIFVSLFPCCAARGCCVRVSGGEVRYV